MNKIYESITGSHLYGTATAESDKDYCGIFIAEKEFYLGLKTVEEINLSEPDKDIKGKNTSLAIDRKFYELRKYVKLAIENNPNILEIMFADTKSQVFINDVGWRLLACKHLFPWQGCKQRFLGYAFSQKHKMVIKRDNILELRKGLEFFTNIQVYKEGHHLLAEYRDLDVGNWIIFYENNAKIGDLNFNLKCDVNKVVERLQNRVDKITNRAGLLDNYGYDTKFGSHLVRLMLEGKELLETGALVFPMKEAATILDIKQGKWSMEEVLEYAEQLENDISNMVSPLPKKPRFDEINKLLIDIVEETFYKGER